MNDLQKEFEATGYTSWINSDLYPDGKIYTQEYTQWLERRVQALSITNVKGQSEQLPCGHKQVELVRHAAKCKDCGTVFETKW